MSNLVQAVTTPKSYREMTPQKKAVYKAAEKLRVEALVKKTFENINRGTLDIIFAGKKTVTRATAERRLRAKGRL